MKSPAQEADAPQGCWQGLAIVERDGLEGYPPPRGMRSRGDGPACRLILDKAPVEHAFSCGEA